MADQIALIRAGLALNLSVIDGIQVSPYVLTNPMLPCIHVFPAATTYDLAMCRGLDELTFTVQALTGAAGDQAAQMNLDQLLASFGPRSVKRAIEADSTLGGTVQDCSVTSSSGYLQFVSGGSPTLMASWTVQIYAKGA